MKTYKIKHLPSGLFFTPVQPRQIRINGENRYRVVQTNLGESGMIYTRRPNLARMIGAGFYSHLVTDLSQLDPDCRNSFFIEDFDACQWQVLEETV